MDRLRWMLWILLLLTTGEGACAEPRGNGFDMWVALPPTPVHVMGRSLLSYELHLTNHADEPLTLTCLDVLDADTHGTLAELSAASLQKDASLIGEPPAHGLATQVGPGRTVVVFLDVVLPHGQAVNALRHRIRYMMGTNHRSHAIEGSVVRLSSARPSRIGPPVRGGPWVAIHSAAWPRGHRRVFYSVAGRATLPGRFAVDWVKLDANGRESAGDADLASRHYGYGQDVIAVADGVVAAVRDGMPEPERLSQRTTHAPAEDAGNYIVQAMPDGRFALYEHLEPGSLRVARGQRVHRGQVLGALGFSGESTGPHLHFHVADTDSPLDGEGLPFVIDRFRMLGRYPDIAGLGTHWHDLPEGDDGNREDEWPAENVVIEFPD